jgi:predicted nucleic acid-binding protein
VGKIVLPASGVVYVDTNAVIYYVEKIEPYCSASTPLWDALDAGTQAVLTSDVTLLEVLVKPLRAGDISLATVYRNLLLGTTGLTSLPIDRTILEAAAGIRAAFGLKTPDAIHAATALHAKAAMLVTNDPGFKRVGGLNVAVLADIAAS